VTRKIAGVGRSGFAVLGDSCAISHTGSSQTWSVAPRPVRVRCCWFRHPGLWDDRWCRDGMCSGGLDQRSYIRVLVTAVINLAPRGSWPWRIAAALGVLAGATAIIAGLTGRGAQSAMSVGHTIVLAAIAVALRAPSSNQGQGGIRMGRRRVIIIILAGAAVFAFAAAVIGAVQGDAILALAMVALAAIWLAVAYRVRRTPQ
jgi:hypothetical protein